MPDTKTDNTAGSGVTAAIQPAIDYILGLRYQLEAGEVLSIDTVKSDVRSVLQTTESQLRKHPRMHTKIETITYLLIAVIDEIIIFSNWSQAEVWQDKPLELEIFGKLVAGEHFYELLEQEGYRDPELAEVFYMCLSLGFGKDRDDIHILKQKLYTIIPHNLPENERHISPGAEHTYEVAESQLPPMFGYMALTVVVVVCVVLYIIASQWLWADAVEDIAKVSQFLTNKGY